MESFDVAVIGRNFGKHYVRTFAENTKVGNIYLLTNYFGNAVDSAARYSAEFQHPVLPIDNLDNLIRNQPKLVSVCTPDDTHVAIGTRLIENGIPVIIEKPSDKINPDGNIDSTKRLVELADRNGVFLTQFLPHHIRRKYLFGDKKLDRVKTYFVIPSLVGGQNRIKRDLRKHGKSHIQNFGPHAVAYIGDQKIREITPDSIHHDSGFMIHCYTEDGSECDFVLNTIPNNEFDTLPPAVIEAKIGNNGVTQRFEMFPSTRNEHEHGRNGYHVDAFKSEHAVGNGYGTSQGVVELPAELSLTVDRAIGMLELGVTKDPANTLPGAETILNNQHNISMLENYTRKEFDLIDF